LKANGVPHDDIVVLLMSDYGLALYGNAIMVNPDFAKVNPNAVRAFLRAFVKGVQDTVRDPESAVKGVIKRSPTLAEASELERLKMSIAKNYVTPDVQKNGIGAVDAGRLARSIEQIAISFKFTDKPPTPADVWTAEFLPPREQRLLPK
jgi:NitT/TauT family transport system substrate-binding protein